MEVVMVSSKESSVLFSLRELMNLEEQRRAEEAADVARRAERQAEASLAAERRAREEEIARRRADEARAREEARESREEAAHLAALREAELERARREAESAARLEELRLRQDHERQQAALAKDGRDRGGILLAMCGALVLALAAWSTTLAARAQHAELALATTRQALADQTDLVTRAQRELSLLHEQLDPASHAAPPSPPVQDATPPKPAAPRSPTPKPPKPRDPAHTCTDRWDPLCGALP
jgi:colicin import membrane protein